MRKLDNHDIQNVTLDILIELDRYCKENGLKYYLAWGTLIGAVRHQGYIPWDDDIDVLMPRPDFNRLLETYRDNAAYTLYSCKKQKNYYLPYMKLVDNRTIQVAPNGKVLNRGADIDIFALDGQPDETNEAKLVFEKTFVKYKKLNCRIMGFRYTCGKGIVARIKHCIADIIIESGILAKIAQKIDAEYAKNDYLKSTSIAAPNAYMTPNLKIWTKSDFEPAIELAFEGKKFYAPCNYDTVLRSTYGNYMQLPPEEKRKPTHDESYYFKD